MDIYTLFGEMRAHMQVFVTRANIHGPKFRDGTAKATWIPDSVLWEFDRVYAWLTLFWHLSNENKATITVDDFTVGAEELVAFNITSQRTLADWVALMRERDRDKLIAFFRADSGDDTLNVNQKLGQLRTCIVDAMTIADGLIDRTGDADTIKYETVGSTKRAVGKTIAEMGINGVPLADAIDDIKAKVGELIWLE